MYLTDFREASLVDVITQLEPGLFRKVTGLLVKDFELLMSIGVFNNDLMNDAIFKFRRYEDSSLSYTGVDKHAGQDVGLFSTVLLREEYDKLTQAQQQAMQPGKRAVDDVPERPVKKQVVSRDEEDEDEEDEEDEPETVPAQPEPVHPRTVNDSAEQTYKPGVPVKQASQTLTDVPGAVPGAKVEHSKFGIGIIQKLKKSGKYTYIACKFKDSVKEFDYPQAFHEKKLTLV